MVFCWRIMALPHTSEMPQLRNSASAVLRVPLLVADGQFSVVILHAACDGRSQVQADRPVLCLREIVGNTECKDQSQTKLARSAHTKQLAARIKHQYSWGICSRLTRLAMPVTIGGSHSRMA
jgi:hypothetical protein